MKLAKKHMVRLAEEERAYLESLVRKGKVAARKRPHAEMLLKADSGGLGAKWPDSQISKARLIALACQGAPVGRSRWALRLLGQLGHVERVPHEMARQALKSALKPWRNKEWRIPPEGNAEFVCMENALDVYKRPHPKT